MNFVTKCWASTRSTVAIRTPADRTERGVLAPAERAKVGTAVLLARPVPAEVVAVAEGPEDWHAAVVTSAVAALQLPVASLAVGSGQTRVVRLRQAERQQGREARTQQAPCPRLLPPATPYYLFYCLYFRSQQHSFTRGFLCERNKRCRENSLFRYQQSLKSTNSPFRCDSEIEICKSHRFSIKGYLTSTIVFQQPSNCMYAKQIYSIAKIRVNYCPLF